ncbi:putative bifunctional diguanylate cyclase/phosphodiesterase [Blastococcus saxobsidens]|uniref:Putative Diguanylate cyclase/phosphodiesterase n=1 Tax=Blastococcus saxobsidens (strain DD2) TaxID=1146883 RepID=H6RTK6_BLASD|nr:bifunctional diguanylate cyclase/phosphodiesterase [Blastococcus saxobsidens]CCG01864.1 putative Diguanylate cyclase/phosphodiesterase [Blastococcus saxobsidens DD2]
MDIEATTPRAPAGGLGRRARTLCLAVLVAALFGLAALLAPALLGRAPFISGIDVPWWAIAMAFAVTEAFVLHIQTRREVQTISFSEIPLVLGMFFAAPLAVVAGRVVAGLVAMLAYRRTSPSKILFNLALLAGETSLAIALFHAIAPGSGFPGPATWLAAYVATLAADILAAVSISVVIVAHDGGVNLRALLSDAGSLVVPLIGTTLALMAVLTLTASLTAGWLLAACGALLLLAFRSYASLAERHLNLERLYRFSQSVSATAEAGDLLADVLAEARDLLSCEQAMIVLASTAEGTVTRVSLGPAGELRRHQDEDATSACWVTDLVAHGGRPLLLPRGTRDPQARRQLASLGMRDAVVVPLSGSADLTGALVVGDRLGDVRTFDGDAVLLLETVANHAGVALRNDELIGRLRYDALHDALTGLPNRTHLQRAVTAALAEVAAGRVTGASVMILDLDEFKEVNDTLGHHQGDALLVEVATRLTAAVGPAGSVARLGGDEFAVLLPATADEDHAFRIARALLRALEQPVPLEGLAIEIGASIGIALAPAHASDTAALLKCADLAMYDAKSSTGGMRLYEPDLHATSPRRLTLVSELRAALHDGSVVVHVQPKAELASGRVVGVEALVRWEHPERGWVPPDDFVSVAERSGLIGLLTTRVLDASLAACARWRADCHDLGVAVNLSTRSLQDPALIDEVTGLLLRYGVPAHRLTLEVTESSVMADPGRAVALLDQLRALGVRLSIDDFGTGYSSLSYLQRLPVQEVKIDRSFLSALRGDGENVAIVRAIVDLGRHLGLDVVAEGVEDQATWDLLRSMGCHLVQGWHLARPMPAEELPGWLAGRRSAPGRHGLRVV